MRNISVLVKITGGIVLITAWLLTATPCYANPVRPFNLHASAGYWVILWPVCPLIEALIVVFFLKRRFAYPGIPTRPFLLVVLLNLLTIPITQIIGDVIIYNASTPNLVYLAELFPLCAEFFVLRWLFNSLYRHKLISQPITSGYTFLLTLAANLITCLAGLAFYRYWPTLFNSDRHYFFFH
jgi:hypothetical protein